MAGHARPERGRRVPGPPRPSGRGGDRDRRAPGSRGQRRRDVPRGDASRERARQEARGPSPVGRRADRDRGGRAARAGGRQGDGAARVPAAAAGRVRRAGRHRRPARPGGHPRGVRGGDRPADGPDPRARGLPLSLLLAVDGDSFAHRAYHALPKSIRLNAVVGFTNMLTRLWEQERPDAVLVAWDTLSVPTYRHEAFAAYQSGRVFEESILEQLDVLPEVVSAMGFLVAKGAGYEADDFLAAAAREWPGEVLVATSDRDAFQLASERVTILQPTKGVSELTRIGPAEVRERYGVEPAQVPDLIALRGDPSDKLPGARGVGPKKAADLLNQYFTLEAMLADGRFSAEAEDLRLYRRIAEMDASAPLPPLRDTTPRWAEASEYLDGLGLGRVAERVAALA
ncbi:MAG: 5'-3' exonuclease [Actinobacteria bacterium]|nr:5'-3' exonuclease [Actinomycetota bacterium]